MRRQRRSKSAGPRPRTRIPAVPRFPVINHKYEGARIAPRPRIVQPGRNQCFLVGTIFGAALASGLLILSSFTSKINVAFGPMTPGPCSP